MTSIEQAAGLARQIYLEGVERGLDIAMREVLRAHGEMGIAEFEEWLVEAADVIAIQEEHRA